MLAIFLSTMYRGDLTNAQWERLQPLLPPQKPKTGRPAVDHRRVLNGMLWLLRTGAPWHDLPERYGPWRTVASRLYRWQRAGVCQQLFDTLKQQADVTGQLDGDVHCIDRTIVRAHQHAAGATKGRPRPKRSGVAKGASARTSTSGPKAPVSS
jgi:transposase